MKSHNEEMYESDNLPGPYDVDDVVEKRRTPMSKGLHGHIRTLEQMLEFKVAKKRTAEQLGREASRYMAETAALSAAVSLMMDSQKEITRMRKCIRSAIESTAGEFQTVDVSWLRKALEGGHARQDAGNGRESHAGLDDCDKQSGAGNSNAGSAPEADSAAH